MELNKLNYKTRRILQLSVVLLLLSFLIGWFVFINSKESITDTKDTTVYIENSTVHVFGDVYSLDFPNKISMHYPYLLLVEPNSQITHIYDLEQKKLNKNVQEILLDYTDGFVLKNEGRVTYLNDKSLEVLCEKGFIKSESEILCLTKINPNTVENKVILIDPDSLRTKDLYVSKDIITDFSYINGTIYTGELNLHTKQNYLIIGDEKIEVPSVVSLIYQMGGKPYFASFNGKLSVGEVYYQVNGDKIELQIGNIYLLN